MFQVTNKTPERRQWHRFEVFVVNSTQILHLFQVILLLTLKLGCKLRCKI